jgi:hypothetical protein
MTILEYEAFVEAYVPKASALRSLYRGGKFDASWSELPKELADFYRITNSYRLMPHHQLCQDDLLIPSTDLDYSRTGIPLEVPVFLLRENQECWRVCIMKSPVGVWHPFIERYNGWIPMKTGVLEILIGHVFEMLTFNDYLTTPKSEARYDPTEHGGKWREDALEILSSSSTTPQRLFTNRNEIEILGWEFADAKPTEYWFDEETRFLWRGKSFDETSHAVQLPHPRAMLPDNSQPA